jgi:hypothetical protein
MLTDAARGVNWPETKFVFFFTMSDKCHGHCGLVAPPARTFRLPPARHRRGLNSGPAYDRIRKSAYPPATPRGPHSPRGIASKLLKWIGLRRKTSAHLALRSPPVDCVLVAVRLHFICQSSPPYRQHRHWRCKAGNRSTPCNARTCGVLEWRAVRPQRTACGTAFGQHGFLLACFLLRGWQHLRFVVLDVRRSCRSTRLEKASP